MNFLMFRFTDPPHRIRLQILLSRSTATSVKWDALKPSFWNTTFLAPSCSPSSPNKGELEVLPSSTPRIELVFGRFKDSPPRLGWEFIDTRFLLGTEASSSKLLPMSGSAAQRTGCERIQQSRLCLVLLFLHRKLACSLELDANHIWDASPLRKWEWTQWRKRLTLSHNHPCWDHHLENYYTQQGRWILRSIWNEIIKEIQRKRIKKSYQNLRQGKRLSKKFKKKV